MRKRTNCETPPPPRKIAQAAQLLHEGGVAAYPTDTVYALGATLSPVSE